MSTFTQWLKDHIEENTPVGDLARDVKLDKNWPKQASSKRTFTKHMKEMNASDGAVEALNTAWKRYMSHQYQRKAKNKCKGINAVYYYEAELSCRIEFNIPGETDWHSVTFTCPDTPSLEKLFASLQNISKVELD
jgi:hypothetical protein